MNKNWDMSPESFEALLGWLDPDRERAGIKYEQIRSGLISFFTGRGHCEAEDLADETINRVISRTAAHGTASRSSLALASRSSVSALSMRSRMAKIS